MIGIEQIRLLEERVLGVVSRLNELRAENKSLRETLGEYQDRIDDLEKKIHTFSDSQAEIEQGILHALKQLDELEDEVTDSFSAEEPAEDSVEPTITESAVEEDVTSEASLASQDPADESEETDAIVEEQSEPELEIF